MDGWSARGDSNPDLHGLNVPRLPVAPRADDGGDHGRTRTATGQALDLLPLPDWATWPLVPPGGLEPPPHGLRARRAAFTLRRGGELTPGIEPGRRPYQGRRLPLTSDQLGANGGIRTRTSRLGRPAGNRYPTFASGSAYGYRTRPSARATRNAFLHTQAERGPVSFTGPSRSVSFQRPRSLRALLHVPTVLGDRTSPRTDASLLPRVRQKQKRPSRGSP